MERSHFGQHGPDCFGCKISSLTFTQSITSPVCHAPGGDPWKNNPVIERMQELSGKEIDTDVANKHRVDTLRRYE